MERDNLVGVSIDGDLPNVIPKRDPFRTKTSTKEGVRAKILSLNLWGLVGVSKHRRERFDALAEILITQETDIDFVFLQEVWSKKDFKKIIETTKRVFPYSHYFYSGMIGSGVCLLSKWPIIDIFSYKYNLNGYAHKFHHGDWFGGKVVGMAKVRHGELIANLYVTHLHAEYDRLKDVYLYHRVSQAFEFSQFVSHTSLGSCDYSIVAGDFNTQPQDLPYRLILYNSRLRDSFEEKENYSGESPIGATCGHPNNCYTGKSDLKTNPHGQRIDYIMYGEGTERVRIYCEKYISPVWKTQSGLSVSDHEPVVAILRISKDTEKITERDPMEFVNFHDDERLAPRIECLQLSTELMASTMISLRMNKIFFYSVSCLLLILLLASIPVDFYVQGTYVVMLHIARIVVSLILGFCFLMGFFWNSIERTALLAAKESMDMLLLFLKSNQNTQKAVKEQETNTMKLPV